MGERHSDPSATLLSLLGMKIRALEARSGPVRTVG
jgi:hypothetical protein